MRILCPHCGERPTSEFTYGGDATVQRPTQLTEDAHQEWADYVYYRDNPRGLHHEFWHHSSGCRAWIQVERNTLTHVIKSSRPMEKSISGYSAQWDSHSATQSESSVTSQNQSTSQNTTKGGNK